MLLGVCVALLLWFLLCRCGFIALRVVLVSLCLGDHFLLPTCQCGDGTTSRPTVSEILAVARITPCRVRNGVCVKTVMAFRTRASCEPLLDRLGVVWTISCAMFYDKWCRDCEGYMACMNSVAQFLTHHLCLPQKSNIKTQRYGRTSIYGNDRSRILFYKVLAGIDLWVLITNLLRII